MRYKMMIASVLLLATTAVLVHGEETKEKREGVYPKVGTAFGKIITVQATIRLVKAPQPPPKDWHDFLQLKIYSVENKKLPEPITIECSPFNIVIGRELGFDTIKNVKESKTMQIIGYETASMNGLPDGLANVIPDLVPTGRAWHVHHSFIVLDMKPFVEKPVINVPGANETKEK
jgi:hypothetical protein